MYIRARIYFARGGKIHVCVCGCNCCWSIRMVYAVRGIHMLVNCCLVYNVHILYLFEVGYREYSATLCRSRYIYMLDAHTHISRPPARWLFPLSSFCMFATRRRWVAALLLSTIVHCECVCVLSCASFVHIYTCVFAFHINSCARVKL